MNENDINVLNNIEIIYDEDLIDEYGNNLFNSITEPLKEYTSKTLLHFSQQTLKSNLKNINNNLNNRFESFETKLTDSLFKKIDNLNINLENKLNNLKNDLNYNFEQKINNLEKNIKIDYNNLEKNIKIDYNNLNEEIKKLKINFEFGKIIQENKFSKFLKLISIYDFEFSTKQLIFIGEKLSEIHKIKKFNRDGKRKKTSLLLWFNSNLKTISLDIENNLNDIIKLNDFPK